MATVQSKFDQVDTHMNCSISLSLLLSLFLLFCGFFVAKSVGKGLAATPHTHVRHIVEHCSKADAHQRHENAPRSAQHGAEVLKHASATGLATTMLDHEADIGRTKLQVKGSNPRGAIRSYANVTTPASLVQLGSRPRAGSPMCVAGPSHTMPRVVCWVGRSDL